MNDAWAMLIAGTNRARSKLSLMWGAIKADIKAASGNVLDFFAIEGLMDSHVRRELEQALMKLGWERDTGDLWRNKRSGVVGGFLDVVVMELQASIQERKPFEGHFFKEP